MKCVDFERLAALEAGGDLAGRDRVRLREHLAACAGCRKAAAELAELEAEFKAWRVEAAEEAAVERVRRGVLARIPENAVGQVGGLPRWAWWAAAAALAALVLVSWLRPARRPPPPVAVVHRVGAPVAEVHGTGQRPVPLVHRPGRRPAPLEDKVDAGTLVIRLATSDPDVVIYWTVEGKGD